MDYDQFIKLVKERAGLESAAEVVQATQPTRPGFSPVASLLPGSR